MYKEIEELLESLNKTKFRGSFHLNSKMKGYVQDKGYDKIESDAYDLITKRIAPEVISNVSPVSIEPMVPSAPPASGTATVM